jgi:hypothetical protein
MLPMRECLASRRKVLGENHPVTVAAAADLKRLEEQATSDSR